jgi:hypothetical protein
MEAYILKYSSILFTIDNSIIIIDNCIHSFLLINFYLYFGTNWVYIYIIVIKKFFRVRIENYEQATENDSYID